MDVPKQKGFMDSIFKRLESVGNDKAHTSRIRFMIKVQTIALHMRFCNLSICLCV